MPTLRQLVAPAVAVVLAAGFALAPASAAPGFSAEATPARSFSLQQGSGFNRLEVQLVQRRSAAALSSASAATKEPEWTACVFGWTSSSFFSDCSPPVRLSSTVAEGSASGRLRFALRDDFWGDTAVVDLSLRDRGGAPALAVGAQPYADALRVSSAPYASLARAAIVSGSVVVTTQRAQRRTPKTYFIAPSTRLQVREFVAGSASAGAV